MTSGPPTLQGVPGMTWMSIREVHRRRGHQAVGPTGVAGHGGIEVVGEPQFGEGEDPRHLGQHRDRSADGSVRVSRRVSASIPVRWASARVRMAKLTVTLDRTADTTKTTSTIRSSVLATNQVRVGNQVPVGQQDGSQRRENRDHELDRAATSTTSRSISSRPVANVTCGRAIVNQMVPDSVSPRQ